MTTKTLHEIVPRTQACVDCGEDLEWLVEGNMSYRMLPDELVVWEIHTPAPEGLSTVHRWQWSSSLGVVCVRIPAAGYWL